MGVSAYLRFCKCQHIPPLPASELTLRYFCAHISKRLSSQTIKVYLAGIRLYHLEHGYSDPTTDTPLLSYLCTGIRRSLRKKARTRSPITFSNLRALKSQLSLSTFSSHDKLLYWAAFTLAFYGFLRVSEYSCPTTSKFDKAKHLLRDDVTLSDSSFSVTLKCSKTDRFGTSHTILVGATGSSTCPVRAMSKFLTLRQYGPSGPLFTLSSGVYLTRSSVSATMKSLLRTAGINPETFSSHSLRIGAATAAAEAGLPDHLIKTLGRWHSHAYQTYIRTSPEVLLKAAKRITQAQ